VSGALLVLVPEQLHECVRARHRTVPVDVVSSAGSDETASDASRLTSQRLGLEWFLS